MTALPDAAVVLNGAIPRDVWREVLIQADRPHDLARFDQAEAKRERKRLKRKPNG